MEATWQSKVDEIASEPDDVKRYRKYACFFQTILLSMKDGDSTAIKKWALPWLTRLFDNLHAEESEEADVVTYEESGKYSSVMDIQELAKSEGWPETQAVNQFVIKLHRPVTLNTVLLLWNINYVLKSAKVDGKMYTITEKKWNDGTDALINPIVSTGQQSELLYAIS